MLKLIRPLHLFLAALTYTLGISLANYLGHPFSANIFWLGLVVSLLTQLSMSLLADVFRLDVEPLLEKETRSERQTLRNNTLYVSIASLAVIAFITYLLFVNHQLPAAAFFFLVLSLILILVYSLPQFRGRGLSEFLLAVQLAYVFPSFAFILQSGETHRFLTLTIPLVFLAFAYFILMTFQSFASDRKYGRVTFLTQLGWERVVPLHHFLVLLAYLLFFTSPAFGVSLSLIWRVFLALPFAIFQILQLRSISLGAPPNWALLSVTAFATFGLTTYLLMLTFWLR
ncbi:MAG TPA: UbiA family prenyltransferase [Anaerolineales bacterium]|nr:UbiA family prenyltransferase [Anaerolineales bacterium]